MEKKYYFDFVKIKKYEILFVISDKGLSFVDFVNKKRRWDNLEQWLIGKNQITRLEKNLDQTNIYKKAIKDFFQGKLNLDKVAFDLKGSEFELRVWNQIATLKNNQFITYHELASLLNVPKSTRAVASAVAKNPVLLLIPCHRIVSKNNQYKYRSGPEIKKMLINLEKTW